MIQIAHRWVTANCPNLHLQEEFKKHLSQAVETNAHCSFCIGRAITKRGKSYMLHWFSGEFFVFELTSWQEQSLHVGDSSWNAVFKKTPSAFNKKGLPVVTLDEVSIEPCRSLACGQRITGHISYDTEAHCFFRHAVQLDYDFPNGPRGTAWHYPESWFLTKGRLFFSFPPIFDREALGGRDGPQTGILFLRLCTVPNPKGDDFEGEGSNASSLSYIQTKQLGSSASVHRLHNPPGPPNESIHPIVSNTRALLVRMDPRE